jgi:hypothetical protein
MGGVKTVWAKIVLAQVYCLVSSVAEFIFAVKSESIKTDFERFKTSAFYGHLSRPWLLRISA